MRAKLRLSAVKQRRPPNPDESFRVVSSSLTNENGEANGAAIVEYVSAKFPFT
jgi:hypothetical protein